jgi:cytochrome c oxidase cbb3-type subunit 3
MVKHLIIVSGARVALAICCLQLFGQAQKKNPVEGDAAAIREGASLFRANCSPCHGLNARGGGRGPDLTVGRWIHGGSDENMFRTISQGVAGTEMPANSFEESETWTLVAYLRSVSSAAPDPLTGAPVVGQQLFSGKEKCANCHMVKGHGGHLGPDLSRVGAARSIGYLTESIREPNKELSLGYADPNNHYGSPLEYDTVTAVTRDGKRIVGVAKNEDAFSIQLLGTDDQLYLLSKNELAEVRHERRSLMPAYGQEMLSVGELQNLLAYLSSLRGE